MSTSTSMLIITTIATTMNMPPLPRKPNGFMQATAMGKGLWPTAQVGPQVLAWAALC